MLVAASSVVMIHVTTVAEKHACRDAVGTVQMHVMTPVDTLVLANALPYVHMVVLTVVKTSVAAPAAEKHVNGIVMQIVV